MSENLHAKHRERMRKRFLETNSDGFSDHELLEILLFYAIPRKNTNDIAHRLLNRFGSFEGVFSASIDELTQVEDIGETSAIFIKTVFALHKRMLIDEMPDTYKTFEEIGELFVKKYKYIKNETMMFLIFDKRGRICRELTIASGDSDSASVDMKKMIAAAACKEAYFAAVAHNHPSGLQKFSFDDEYVTITIRETLQTMGIKLVDHYLITDGEYKGMLNGNFADLNI